MSEHTKEPWRIRGSLTCADFTHITSDDFDNVAVLRKPSDARRIVACVNWCEGIPIEKLEAKDEFTRLADYYRVSKQRDELLAALKESNEFIGYLLDHLPEDKRDNTIFVNNRAVIAKVEGEK